MKKVPNIKTGKAVSRNSITKAASNEFTRVSWTSRRPDELSSNNSLGLKSMTSATSTNLHGYLPCCCQPVLE
jgi:hypothetical protein